MRLRRTIPETDKRRIELKEPSALDETLEKIALLSKIESVDDLSFFGDRISVIPAALGDIADLEHLNLKGAQIKTLQKDLRIALSREDLEIKLAD
jgi:hypothetical protein